MTASTVLVDYGSGNIRSVAKALEHTASKAGLPPPIVTSQAELVAKAERIVLPGQGAFGDCLGGLQAVEGLVEALNESVLRRGVPILGICVGMQLMADRGLEFGSHQGLGWVPGDVKSLPPTLPITKKIPHMGWTRVEASRSHRVTDPLDGRAVYFAHSYHFDAAQDQDGVLHALHGMPLVAAVARDNIVGVQFHPEKSQVAGLELMEAFQSWRP